MILKKKLTNKANKNHYYTVHVLEKVSHLTKRVGVANNIHTPVNQ